MTGRAARRIRAGIMSRCLPYTAGQDGDGFYTCLDFATLRTYLTGWERWKHTRLARKAHDRTRPWTLSRPQQHRQEIGL